MINLTDDILIINKKGINKAIKDSFKSISNKICSYRESVIPDSLDSSNLNLAFPFYFNNKTLKSLKFDSKMLNDFLEYAMNPHSENMLAKYKLIDTNILMEKAHLKSAMKLVLVDLWLNKFILLPLHFNLKVNSFSDDFVKSFESDFIKTLKNDMEGSDYFKTKYPQSFCKIIRSSTYQNYQDISIEEINELHIHVMKSKRGEIISKAPKINFFIEAFLEQVKTYNQSLNYDAFEYSSWIKGFFRRHKEISYVKYLTSKNELYEYRLDYISKQKKDRKKSKQKKDTTTVITTPLTIEEEFIDSSKKYSWGKATPKYFGYSFDIENDSKVWVKLFDQYLTHRMDNGYETQRNQKRMFNFFMNYIFFYLNLWNQKNNNKISLPLAPKDFHRTFFFTNKNIKNENEALPFTLIELLNIKTNSASIKNSFIRELQAFFGFIIDFYEEEETIWSKNLYNPIKKIDQFKEFKNKKTNKVIIPKTIYGKLKKYLFALEFFGEYLLEKSINERVNVSNYKADNIRTSDYGFTPVFFFDNKAYPIFEVPNTYFARRRFFNEEQLIKNCFVEDNDNNLVTKRIPSNTIIRAFILMLNTGLRGAQVSWMDLDSWDKYTTGELNLYYKMNVNTDKVKDTQWQTYVSKSVYDSLQKETLFQKSMREDFMDKEITYQNREYSRFEDIKPLFRGHTENGLPVNFRNFWVDILWCFQNLINSIEKTQHSLIKIEKPEEINIIENDQNHYCKLNIKAVHTPHAMRATFCTHMAEYLERSEIAALVGHQSDLITSEVYIKPEESTIMKKMDEALDIFENGVNSDYFKKESVAHTKPNAKNSSLQQAFAQDRDQTIELFNISSISMNINKESEEQSKKAIELLKNSRMDHIIFETTHICPVGGICPQEVMGIIGEKRRCGLCPLALKCVDNLNPIYAKQRDLIREIKEDKAKLDKAIENNESEITLNNIEDKINMDIRELVSWKFSADILSQHYEALRTNPDLEKEYFVEMPDMVKNHLQKVSVSNEKEYLLTRIADSNAYSIYSNGENKYQAEMIKRNVIRNLNLIEYEDYYVSDDEKIEVFCAMISNMMETNGVDLKELIEYDCFKAIEQKKEKKQLLFKEIKLLK